MCHLLLLNCTKLLGVMFRSNCKMDMHLQNILSKCTQRLYLMKLLKHHGMPQLELSLTHHILHYCFTHSICASAGAYHLPVGSSCLPMSVQHGATLPHHPAPTGEQRWLPAASTVVVGQARCSSHRTRDHRWPCVQFNCSSCVEQFANGSAVF